MATPSRLVRLGAVVLCAAPRIGPVEAFALRFPVFSRPSPLSKVSCHRPCPPSTASGWPCSAARAAQEDAVEGREDTQEDGDAAENSWHDPSENRVKIWMRKAAGKRDHNRVAMYLRKYREGKARRGELPSIAVYNTALRALDRCSKWRLALSVFREMQSDGVKPDRDSYFFVMSACSRRGEARTALALLKEMRSAAAHNTRQTQTQTQTLLGPAGSSGEGGGGGGGERVGPPPVPDLLVYAVVVKACAWGKLWRQAVRLLDEMSAEGVQPNVVVLNTALSACAKCGQVARATQLLHEMQGKYGVAPEVRSYNSVISGHERAGEWREALALAKDMERAAGAGGGVSPNVVTFNSVIGACKRAGRAEEALAVLSMLRRKGLQPDVISFNSAMGACASEGKWEAALQLLELMPSEGVAPDLVTYNIALDACVKGGQWEMAMSIFEELGKSDDEALRPDLYTYNTLMTVFSNAGMLPRALQLLEEAKAVGLCPDVVTYSTLVRACERSMPSQPEVALQLVNDMEAAGVRPNNTTFVSVALSLGRAGRPLECVDLLASMREKGTPPDAVCYQAVLRVLDRWDRAEEASALFEEMMTRQRVALVPALAEEMYGCGIRALEKLGRWSEAVSLLEEWRDTGAYDADNDKMYDQWYRALRLLAAGGLPQSTDVKTARAAIVSAARGGLAEEALAIMRSMEGMGFELGVVEYGAAIEAFEKAGKPERGLEMLDEMISAGVEPDVLCFAAATRCCCRRLDWAAAISFLETTLREGFLPTSSTLETVAGLCRNSGRYQELWDLKDLMRNIVVDGGGLARPGSSIYVSLIRACGAARRPDLVLRCLAEMNADSAPGKSPGTPALNEPYTVSAAIGALSACGETAEADRIYLDAIQRKILPDPATGRTWATAAAAIAGTAAAAAAGGAGGGASPLPSSGVGGSERQTRGAAGAAGDRSDGGMAEAVSQRGGGTTTYRDRGSGRGGVAGVGGVELSSAASQQLQDIGNGRGDGAGVGAEGSEWGGRGRGGGGGATRGRGREKDALLLWVDLRRAPVAVIPSAVRRVVKAVEAVGDASDGLVVQWVGARGEGEEEGADNGGGDSGIGRVQRPRGKPATAGRRGTVLEAFGRVKPALAVTEPPTSRGQVRVEKEELQRWLRKVRGR